MGKKATVYVHPSFQIGEISPRLYSAFLEPIGNMVEGMMYNPKHPTADEQGFRKDVIEAIKGTDLPAVRLPGGNYVSGWDWKDSIGPKEQRKVHLDLAWHQIYDNQVGHDEYLQWAEKAGFEPLYTINLGTGDINDAIYITEYTNHEGGTYWSDLRRKNGHEKPYGVKMWYLGNEMDGPWQIGSWELDPRGYGIRANEVSKAMKWVDGSIETAVCMSCSPLICHYPEWDLSVLQECYESVDYLSMHYYHVAPQGDIAALLGGSVYYEDYINTEIALSDYVQTKCRSPKKMMISFDEYGTHGGIAQKPHYGFSPTSNLHQSFYSFPKTKYVKHDPNASLSVMGPRGSEMLGALANTSAQLAFLRHADRVKIGCMTGGLGALVANNRDNVWRGAAFYPYAHLMRYGRGTSLRTAVDCETFDIPAYFIDDGTQYQAREGLPYLDTAAAVDEAKGELNIFVINRNWESDINADIDVSGFEGWEFVEHIQMYTEDMEARNTFEAPNAIQPTVNTKAVMKDGKLNTDLKRLSWNVLRFRKPEAK